jgi:FlaA1/EpsC-like NDP-sugar epimerase
VIQPASHNAGKTVLITGAGGCIGSALAKAVADAGPRLILIVDHSERNLYEIHMALTAGTAAACHTPILGDISDEALIGEVLEKYRPEIIFHAAAFKHVPLMETNPIAVIRNNALGTWALATAALRHGVSQLLMISTDKAVNPRSVMGAAKRVAELILLRLNCAQTRMSALRLGNVLGSHGSVVPVFQQQIARGGPLTVSHPDASRYFLSLGDTVELILAAAALPEAEGQGIFVPKLGSPLKILDLANRLMQEAGRRGGEVEIVWTGLRAGDKLREELIFSNERLEPTADSRLRKVSGPQPPPRALDSAMQLLSEAARSRNLSSLLDALSTAVPEYQPSETLLDLLNQAKRDAVPT